MPIYPNRSRPLQLINDTLYLIQAKFTIDQVKNVEDIKRYLGSDVAFRVNKEGVFYFCEEVPEVEYEEIQ